MVEKSRYNVYEERFIRWLRIIKAENILELESLVKGDEIMEETLRFVKEWREESAKNGFQRYIEDLKFEAEERGELKRNKEVAKNLLNLNIDIEDIMKATGLTKKQITKLR